ncbi:cellulose biosynthesis protein BcsD [Novosphingobium pituita]|jgi:hypothetical protein|uniref:Cellulose synthase n=1 Tax=Novosphingobium pituita TaxID=3056842 RepID=A0ABQ6P8S6_9SPHN|nr:cellulose biosynthesis protein BcsD [Novosphingobium sp. IK01]GMM61629.1 hypothetical protein NUTIK01_24060 [Novosphingobium sp. IK01]
MMFDDPIAPRPSGSLRFSTQAGGLNGSGNGSASASGGATDAATGASFLVAMIARELASAATPDQHHGFFTAVGRRIAAVVALGDVEDLGTMTTRINALWAALGWGSAVVTVEDSAILVRHDGLYPESDAQMADPWRTLLPPLMEGTYDTWFRMMGSGQSLTTTAHWKGHTLEIRHGR